ncbi:MAG: DMT family transporter [Burkholderiales bacterium]|nr:DMT family transporter [Burkholderiales bacterium]
MIVASVLFACMGVCVKLSAREFTTPELVFYRCFIGWLVVSGVVVANRGSLASPVLPKQFTRAIAGTISLMMYFYGIAHLPLATAVTLNYTSPIFLALLTAFWLKERPPAAMWGAVLLGFVGVALLLHPTIGHDQWFAGLIGLASGFGAGIAYLNVRMLGDAGEPDWRTVFYFSLVAAISSGIWMLFGRFSPLNARNLPYLLAMGACATGAQLSMTRAYRVGKSMVVAPFAYTTVVCSSLFGELIWGDQLGVGSWVAMGLIMLSGIWTLNASRH